LNSPENLIKGIGWMLKKNAPLFIRPRAKASWSWWMIQFVRHCFGSRRQVSAAGRGALMTDAISLYDTLIKTEGINCHWDTPGACHLFHSKKEFTAFGATNHLEGQNGFKVKALIGDPLYDLLPAITHEVVGMWHDQRVALLRPDTFMCELASILKNKGVEIVEQTEFTGFNREFGRAVSVHTNQGLFAAEAFVVATGAWTPMLSDALQCRIPIQPGKGYSITFRRPANSPTMPCFFEEKRVVVTPWPDSLRLGGTMEFSGFDDNLNPLRLDALLRALKQYMPISIPDQMEERWCGWRPITWDGLPIIDHLPGFENVVLAVGHNELGVTMAPATGQLVAAMTNREAPRVDLSFYRINRFF
jgi:D-amino-acid dehydrogenase